ncbi:MAG: nitroreductase [Actinobacteria bacterium RBG_16_68_21]|nr:MAG: nitroreductase [Actinobacteria bacterium RBG_16_68_21]
MEVWEAIRSRRNVREFTAEPIPGPDLDQILEAARLTPSSRNRQAWDFVVVTDRERLAALAGVWRGAGHVGGAAAAIVIVLPEDADGSSNWLYYDAGQATMSLMVAAAGLGIGTAHAAVEDQALAQEILGYPGGYFSGALISLGYPADRPLAPIRKPNRRPFAEVIHRERW